MLILIYILVIFSFIYLVSYKSKRYLHMLQQNLYNENNRYLRYLIKQDKFLFELGIINIIICLFGIFIFYDLKEISEFLLIITCIINYLVSKKYRKIIKLDQNKKPLVITKRVKRLIVTISLIYLVPIIMLMLNINDLSIAWRIFLIENILLYLNNYVVLVANIINYPIEKIVYLYYKTKAINKLRSMPNLKIVGITGSYGKTSSKNILSEILSVKYNCLPTPKNLNTFYGLIITINNLLDKFCDIFIAEMGAYVKGEIKGLCKLVKPRYGILTTIGTAHLETFGSQENIIKGKFELIESLPKNGIGVLNGDDEKQVNYKLKNKVKIVWYGINNKDVDVRATNIKCSSKGTSFDLIIKDNPKKYRFETKLLGEHNVYNILSSVALGLEFGINIEDMIDQVKLIKPIEHRLELKKLFNFYQIDDAYNSNPIGATNACKILRLMNGIKVVVTPGMIELGNQEYELNKKFGVDIASVADYVILIGEKRTKPIKDGLLSSGFDKDKIIIYNDVKLSFNYIRELAANSQENVYALYENDLPDTYNEN